MPRPHTKQHDHGGAQTPSPDPNPDERDAFISHAGEDKAEVARPIADALIAAGWSVWLDEYELTVGDSLNQRINDGLFHSRFGVVILSQAFFAKHWPKQELDGLAAKEAVAGAKVILPVWHGIDEKYLADVAPMLAGRLGASTMDGIPKVVQQVIRALARERHTQHDLAHPEPLVRSVFAAQPSGLPATKVNDEILLLLRRSDAVGLEELLRRERIEFDESIDDVSARIGEQHGGLSPQTAPAVHRELLPVLERRLAGLVPLVLHDRERFANEVDWLVELKGRQMPWGPALISWALWWLCYALGTFAANQRRFAALAPLLAAQCPTPYGQTVPLADPSPQDGRIIPEGMFDRSRWYDPPSKLLLEDLSELALFKERYRELTKGEDQPGRSFTEFDFVICVALSVHGYAALARWTLYSSGWADAFARRLSGDARLRATVAEAAGLSLEEFDAHAADHLRAATALGQYRTAPDIFQAGLRKSPD